jgi:hypothetical protein
VNALADTLRRAHVHLERERGKVADSAERKRQWRENPANRAIEAKRKRDNRRKP